MALLELRGITKIFGTNVANDAVDLDVQAGEVHALVGENGAGKTTLMSICGGLTRADAGQIYLDGKPVTITSPPDAHKLGIGMVHQHFKLVPNLTVAANVFLGREQVGWTRTISRKEQEAQVRALSQRFGLPIDPSARIDQLSVGVRQRVELLKALSHETRLLILDEPTAVLTPAESDELFRVVRDLAGQGCGVVFITHKLGEVLKVADTVSVMRDGRMIDTRPAAGLSEADIARLMVGREVLLRVEHPDPHPGDTVLVASGVSVLDDRGVQMVHELSLELRAGEIVGVAGVEGNGQKEFADAVAGLRPCREGSLHLRGRDITRMSVAQRRDLGIAYIPEDRNEVGSVGTMSISDNLIATHTKKGLTRWGWLIPNKVHTFVRKALGDYDVRNAIPEAAISSLSGGNMQKVVIAREFSAQPDLLIASQPTRGVDVGAMEYVHNAIIAQRDAGSAVLLISADLNEVLSLSDRLVVFYRGHIIAHYTRAEFDPVSIGLAMAGIDPLLATEQQRATVDAGLTSDEAVENLEVAAADAVHVDIPAASGLTESVVDSQGEAAPAERRAPRGDEPSRLAVQAKALGKALGQPLIAVALALLVGLIVIVALGANPWEAYQALLLSSFQNTARFGAMITQFVPLLVIAASVIISFRAGFFNIGGEGQLYLGALCGAWAGFTFTGLPGFLLIPLVLVFGAVAGAAWGFIPGYLLAKWDVNVIVTTLMMSTIATLLTSFLVTGPLLDKTAGQPATAFLADQARVKIFDPKQGPGMGLWLALAVIVVVGLVMRWSTWGLRVRELGENPDFARYAGTSVSAMTIQVMAISGAIAGIAGAIVTMDIGRFLQSFSPGYGFLGITVALLARLNPWGSILAALFYADMMAGAMQMQINTPVPYPLVNVLQGLIIVFITAEGLLRWHRKRRTAPPVSRERSNAALAGAEG